MIRLSFTISPREDNSSLFGIMANLLGVGDFDFEIRKKSLDARRNRAKYVYTADIFLKSGNEEEIAAKCGGLVLPTEEEYALPLPKNPPKSRPLVVGFGPAGIFASLALARAGLRPIILEKGKDVWQRKKDVDAFFKGGEFNESSNIQFGEGGAGAFSDGKLNTLVKDKSFRGQYVLKELVLAGAPKEVAYLAKPHIGTDKLLKVVENLRKEIISLGGEIQFETEFTDIEITDNAVSAVIAGEKRFEAQNVFLATGQSCRDLMEMLYEKGVEMEQKPFSVGFRVEHLQDMINLSQYGENGDIPFLPPAEYKLFHHCKSGRTVYSFCMCPGGHVVNASAEKGHLVTNGMSYHARDGKNANAAILCEVLPKDLGESLFAGFDYRESLEKQAFLMGGMSFTAPAMRLSEYLGTKDTAGQEVLPTYPRGVKYCDVSKLFNEEMNDSFREAFKEFGKKIKGFDGGNAIITAVESRTSSPVRIVRQENRQSNIQGLYPIGEGAGHAGGIISAAIDGLKSAESYILSL